MSRGRGWWGTPPLVVGGAGLLLLAFGARGMTDDDEINGPARHEAESIEQELNLSENRREVYSILQSEEANLARKNKQVDLVSLAPEKGQAITPEQAAEARKRIYDALSVQSEPGAAVAGRIAFYAGLILVFTAGVLLYRRTPESNRGSWQEA